MTRTILGWASRSARPAMTHRRRCCGTPWRRSCGGGPPSPSSVPSAGWSVSRRASCAGWSGSPMPRWPSSNAGGRSTSTPSSAWTRPPSAAARAAWPRHLSRSPPPSSRRPCVWRSRRCECPARHRRGAGRPAMPAGVSSSTSATSRKDRDQAGELSAEQVAGYIAKYATKATESFGAALTAGSPPPTTWSASTSSRCMWPSSSGRPGSWAVGPSWKGCGCGRGRTCSGSAVTGRPRAAATPPPSPSCVARVSQFAKRRRARDGIPLDAWDRPEDDQAVIVVASWIYVGSRLYDRGRALAGPVGRCPCPRTCDGSPGRNFAP